MNRTASGQIAQTEARIITLLAPAFPDFKVDPWPDNMARYQLLHNKGAILVSYRSRTGSGDDPMCLQDRQSVFAVTVASRNLRQRDAHQGVYDALEEIDSILSDNGFSFVRDGFTSEDSGVWLYTMQFSINLSYGV